MWEILDTWMQSSQNHMYESAPSSVKRPYGAESSGSMFDAWFATITFGFGVFLMFFRTPLEHTH